MSLDYTQKENQFKLHSSVKTSLLKLIKNMKVNLIATEGRLVVRVLPDQDKSAGGILLAKPSNPDVHFGVIESVGEPLKDRKQSFEVGQTVAWSNYSGVSYEYEGEDYLIINQSDIIAIKSEE